MILIPDGWLLILIPDGWLLFPSARDAILDRGLATDDEDKAPAWMLYPPNWTSDLEYYDWCITHREAIAKALLAKLQMGTLEASLLVCDPHVFQGPWIDPEVGPHDGDLKPLPIRFWRTVETRRAMAGDRVTAYLDDDGPVEARFAWRGYVVLPRDATLAALDSPQPSDDATAPTPGERKKGFILRALGLRAPRPISADEGRVLARHWLSAQGLPCGDKDVADEGRRMTALMRRLAQEGAAKRGRTDCEAAAKSKRTERD